MNAHDLLWIVPFLAVWYWLLRPDPADAHRRRMEVERERTRRAEVQRDTERVRASGSIFRK